MILTSAVGDDGEYRLVFDVDNMDYYSMRVSAMKSN